MKIRIVKPCPQEGYEGKTVDFLKHNTVEIDLDDMIDDLWCSNCQSNSGIHYANHIYLETMLEGK